MYTVYVEYILLDNILMNYLILYVTAWALKMKPKTWRLILAALIGAVYALFELMYYPSVLDILPVKILLSFAIILTALRFYTAKEFLKSIVTFYLVTFIFGGSMFAIAYILGGNFSFIGGVHYYGGVPIRLLLIAVVTVLIFLRLYKQFNVYFGSNHSHYRLQIFMDEKSVSMDAVLDTGNELIEPISRTPVIIADAEKLRYIFGKELIDYAKNIEQNESHEATKESIRLLPYETIEGGKRIMVGVRPTRIIIEKGKNKKVIEDVYIGINTTGVLLKGAGVLLNPLLIYDI